MPGKKKSGKARGGIRPSPTHQDSLRRDIEASQNCNIDALTGNDLDATDEAGEGLDVADELLATLDARDRAADKVQKASMDEQRLSKGRSGSSQSAPDLQKGGSSPLRNAGEKLLQAGEKIFGHHQHSLSPPSSSQSLPLGSGKAATLIPSDDVDKELATDMHRKGSIRQFFGQSPPKAHAAGAVDQEMGKRKVSRQKARMERKTAEMEAQRLQAEEELKANGGKPDEAERERVAITDLCRALKVEMKEINPDGHCLYAAVADQLNILGKAHGKIGYSDTRKATAEYMRTHSDDFMPFISDSDEHMAGIENKEAGQQSANVSQQEKYFLGYCDAVEKTAVWGGQPEILALSRAFHTPIHVVQAGSPVMKVGSEEGKEGDDPVVISYHRHMYGLGEHYNSLHKLKA